MNTSMITSPSFRIVQPRLNLPVMRGVIERRMLVNFCCAPETVAKLLPAPFRPKLVRGQAMAGICLSRLAEIRPGFVPAALGLESENAAHRIAVVWDEAGETREGVFIPRRDTSSRLNQLAGGRLFPGEHHPATFTGLETAARFKLEMRAADGGAFVRVAARVADTVPDGSVFRDLAEASQFFVGGALGWSARVQAGEFDGLELHCAEWRMEPLTVERVESSFFGDTTLFPPGSARFDSAFLMRNIRHEWRARGRMVCDGGEAL
jgi:hypothetical protein